MAAVLTEEPHLATRVVQVANSTGPTRLPARNAEQAIGRLGATGVRTALLEIACAPRCWNRASHASLTFSSSLATRPGRRPADPRG